MKTYMTQKKYMYLNFMRLSSGSVQFRFYLSASFSLLAHLDDKNDFLKNLEIYFLT